MKRGNIYHLGTAVLLYIAGPAAMAQPTFQELYTVGYDQDLYPTIHTISSVLPNHYLMLSHAVDNTNNKSYMEVHRVDDMGQLIWTREISANANNFGWTMAEASNGEFLVSGMTYPSANKDDFMLTRLDPSGTTVWTHYYEVANTRERCYGVVEDPATGNIFLGGYSNASNTGGTGTSDDVAIWKLDSNGTVLWAKEYGGALSDRGGDVYMGFNSNEVVTSGNTWNWGNGQADAAVVAVNSNTGAHLWSKAYGGTGYDEMFIKPTSMNTYIGTGHSNSWGAGQNDIWLTYLDKNGNMLWSKTYGTTADERSYEVVEMPDGFAVCGYTDDGPHGGYDILVFKVDFDGHMLWSWAYGGDLNEFAWGIDRCTDDDGIVVSSDMESYSFRQRNAHLMKISNDGTACNCDNIDYPLSIYEVTNIENSFVPAVESYSPTLKTASVASVTANSRTLCMGDFSGFTLRPAGNSGHGMLEELAPQLQMGAGPKESESTIESSHTVEMIGQPTATSQFDVRATASPATFEVYADDPMTGSRSFVRITDMNGNLVMNQRFKQSPMQLDLGKLPSGIYVVTMEDRGNLVGNARVSVVH